MTYLDVWSYRRIADDVRSHIETGDLKPGDRLPALPALMAQYRVSRDTARHAIRALVAEGLVVVRHGHGTFVRQHAGLDGIDFGGGRAVSWFKKPTGGVCRLAVHDGGRVLYIDLFDEEVRDLAAALTALGHRLERQGP